MTVCGGVNMIKKHKLRPPNRAIVSAKLGNHCQQINIRWCHGLTTHSYRGYSGSQLEVLALLGLARLHPSIDADRHNILHTVIIIASRSMLTTAESVIAWWINQRTGGHLEKKEKQNGTALLSLQSGRHWSREIGESWVSPFFTSLRSDISAVTRYLTWQAWLVFKCKQQCLPNSNT